MKHTCHVNARLDSGKTTLTRCQVCGKKHRINLPKERFLPTFIIRVDISAAVKAFEALS